MVRSTRSIEIDGVHVTAHETEVVLIVHQERIVSVDRAEFGVRHRKIVVEQGLHDLERTAGREAPVRGKGQNEEACPRRGTTP